MNKTAIIFDADGVLVRSEMFTSELERTHQIDKRKLAVFFDTEFAACLTGEKDLKKTIAKYLSECGWEKPVEDFIKQWFLFENRPDWNLLEKVEILRAHGYHVCVATNQERYRTNYMRVEMKFNEHFDAVFSSCELRAKKPDKLFFKRVEMSLEHCDKYIFFDDKEANVNAAREIGWESHLYRDINDFLIWLENQRFIQCRQEEQ